MGGRGFADTPSAGHHTDPNPCHAASSSGRRTPSWVSAEYSYSGNCSGIGTALGGNRGGDTDSNCTGPCSTRSYGALCFMRYVSVAYNILQASFDERCAFEADRIVEKHPVGACIVHPTRNCHVHHKTGRHFDVGFRPRALYWAGQKVRNERQSMFVC